MVDLDQQWRFIICLRIKHEQGVYCYCLVKWAKSDESDIICVERSMGIDLHGLERFDNVQNVQCRSKQTELWDTSQISEGVETSVVQLELDSSDLELVMSKSLYV